MRDVKLPEWARLWQWFKRHGSNGDGSLPGLRIQGVACFPMGSIRRRLEAMTRQKVLDLYFMDARCKLIELAAFLDRVDRAEGPADFRLEAFRQAMRHLGDGDSGRAEAVLRSLSDPTAEPIAQAPGKGAVGAWPGR